MKIAIAVEVDEWVHIVWLCCKTLQVHRRPPRLTTSSLTTAYRLEFAPFYFLVSSLSTISWIIKVSQVQPQCAGRDVRKGV